MSSWGSDNPPNWRKIRQEVLKRDGHVCQLQYPGVCIGAASQVDHVQSLASRGLTRATAPDDVDGLQSVCRACHDAKSDREKRAGQLFSDARRAARKKLPKKPHPGTMTGAADVV